MERFADAETGTGFAYAGLLTQPGIAKLSEILRFAQNDRGAVIRRFENGV
jgi:hypothetical protein